VRVRCPFCGAETDADEAAGELACPSCGQAFSVLREAQTLTEAPESETSSADAATVTHPRVRVNCFQCAKEFTIPLGEADALCPRCGAPYSISDRPPGAHATAEGLPTARTVVSARGSSPLTKERQKSAEASLHWLQEHFEGRYEVLGFVSRGGMGAVFKVRQKRPSREVAMKVMLGGAFATETNRKRFEREAHAVARLNHPAIVPVYEFGEVGGQPYFTMEFVEGKNLRTHVAEKGLSREQICRLMVRVCDAIHYAHEHGVIHRDLKPGNIMVDSLERARILDFGLSRASVEGDDRYDGLTVTGDYMGTPRYMSPEQAMGNPRAVDERTDVYSLGMILYELIVGVLPYPIEHARGLKAYEMLLKHEPLRPSVLHPNMPRDLEIILLKAVQKDKEQRYKTAEALARDLENYLEDRPIAARPATLSYRFNKWALRRRRVLGPICAAALVIAAVSFVYWKVTASLQADLRETSEDFRAVDGEYSGLRARLQEQREQVTEHVGRGEWQAAAAAATSLAKTDPTEPMVNSLPQFVRRHADRRVEEAVADFASLLRRQSYADARAAAEELSALALLMPYEDLADRLAGAAGDFEEACWTDLKAAVHEAYAPGEATQRIERFLGEWPDGPHRQEAEALLAQQEGLDTEQVLKRHEDAVVRALQRSRWPDAASALASAGNLLTSLDEEQAAPWRTVFDNLQGRLDAVIRPGNAARVAAAAPGLATGGFVKAVQFAPDGSWFAAAAHPRKVSIWSWPGRTRLCAWQTGGEVRSLAVSPDGELVATGDKAGQVQVWSAADGRLVRQMDAGPEWVSAVQFSPDGALLVSATAAQVALWQVSSGARLDDRFPGATRPAIFSPDGRHLVAAREDVGVGVWELGREAPLFEVDITGLTPSALCLSPDGRLLATAHTGGEQRKARLWRMTWGEPVLELTVSTGAESAIMRLAWGLAFSPDGRLLATGDSAGFVKLWDVGSGDLRREIPAHSKAITSAAFSPDGRVLVTGGNDGTVRFWATAPLPPAE